MTLESPARMAGRGENSAAAEAQKQLRLAGPLVAGSLLRSAVPMISLMFVGRLGELPLAAASLATSFAAVTAFSVLTGIASALDTLCGQAFGARQYYLLGIYKQRAMLVLALVSVPIAVLWAFAGRILSLLGQNREIAGDAGAYVQWMIPGLFAYGPLLCHAQFLQAQSIVLPVMLSSGTTALIHVIVCWMLAHKLRLGSKGAALAAGISYCIDVSLLAFFVRLSNSCKNTWTGFSKEAFRDILGFLNLAIPSALMVW